MHTMDSVLTWWMLLFCLIKLVHLEPHLSKQDFALLALDGDPKCFTRDLEDFTCFSEAPVGKSYDFFYMTEGSTAETRCDVKQQSFEDKRVLQICTFPSEDVLLFAAIHIRVTDRDTNITIYNRTVSVEDQVLLYPPSNISLHPTGRVGEILVEWKGPKYDLPVQYEIRCSYKNSTNIVIQVSESKSHNLKSLVPGQSCTVQMRAKPAASKWLWGDWSSPVTAMVPQPAGDIELQCHTSDLNQVLCKWRGELHVDSKYYFYYKQKQGGLGGNWELCSRENNTIHQCVLYGQESSVFQFYLSGGPLGQTFYAENFNMKSNIQTKPPGGLKVHPEEGRLCLTWDSPFLKISQYLRYQIRYQRQRETEWKDFTTPSSNGSTCLDVQRGSQYTIQVRAQPDGSVYSGDWSDWSKPLTALLPLGKEWIFILVALLILAGVMISFTSRYFRKVKKSLWPSVPNLNKVLEGILTDISGPHWEPTFNIKQCDDDSAPSLVEILSEKESAVKPSKKCTSLLLPERGLQAGEKTGENFGEDLEMAQDYVILNNDLIPCFTGNDYVYNEVAFSRLPNEKPHCNPECNTNILNHSYLLLAEQSELEDYHLSCHQYTNMEITAVAYVASGE